MRSKYVSCFNCFIIICVCVLLCENWRTNWGRYMGIIKGSELVRCMHNCLARWMRTFSSRGVMEIE